MVVSFRRAAVLLVAAGFAAGEGRAAEAFIVVQRSPLAGFRHHEGPQAWPQLALGERLELIREADNPYDANAVKVLWRGRSLGYMPRLHNAAVARHLDRGVALEARIAALKQHRNRSVRIEFEVVAPLPVR